ncbi:MAG TPA: Ig-like domain-containing protein [Prolixibacteraceae bacterium]|nr:Ig-like domain-containing protein [Prolixibacteraceae bacterium]
MGSPIPGLFAGITAYGEWNFTTQDKLAPTVAYSFTKRADDKVATTSDITITFSKPIEKVGGGAITNSDVATLFTLKKTAGPGFIGSKAFVGEINADKTVVKVLNSSLVTLGEFTALSDYTIEINAGAVRGKTNNVVLGANLQAFQTSDYTAPDVVVSVANAVADVKKDEATVTFASTDNVELTTVYYTIQEGDANTAAPSASAVKADKSAVLTGAAKTVTYKFEGLKEETSYVVWAVAIDKAGNESAVKKAVFVTDDATKPVLVAKPESFVDGKLTFTFSEAVSPVAGSVRILDAASMKEIAVLGLNAVAGKPAQLVTDVWTPATTDALVNYYVEIDKGLVADVPVVATDNVNTFDGLFRTDLMVSSKDATAPVLTAPVNAFANTGVNTTYSLTLTFSEPVQKVGTIPADAFKVERWNGNNYEPFEVIDPANVVTNGTKTVVVNIARQLASTTQYQISINKASFEDLAGNDHAAGTLVGTITTKDVVAPTATFAPANAATGILAGVTTLTITFNEAIRLADNSVIDAYDLDSLVYFSKGATPVAFDAVIDGTAKVITLTVPALVKDATYTYGFKAKFEDASDNLVAAASATFKTETTSVAAAVLAWTPVKNTTTAPWLGSTSPITMTFTSPVFTLRPLAAENNLPVTADYLKNTALVVYKDGVVMPTSELIFSVVDNKTFTVAPKTNWESSATIKVEVLGGTLQLNEGNMIQLNGAPFDASTYKAEDIIDPTVVTYYPAKVGVNGVSPVIAKTEKLTLTFSEDVKVGAGTVEIHRWDGVLAKPAMVVTVDATNKKLVTLGDLTGLPTNQEYYAIVNPGIVSDVTDSNPYAGLTEVKSWKFSLKDDATPQVASYLPNAANTPVTTNLTINFDRPVELTGAGYVALYKSAAGGDAVQIMRGADNSPVNGPISISGNTVTVKVNPLSVNTQYFVEVAEGTFKSSTGVNQAAMPRGNWSFTTEVNANPTIIAEGKVPANNATGVSVDQDLQVTFDMPVEAGTGNIQLHAADGSIVYNFDVKGTDVIIADAVVKVNLPKLAENKQYYVIIPTTAIRNKTYTPEYFAGVIVPYEWKFNTKTDATSPKVVATSATTPGKLNIELNFSEPVLNVDTTSVTVTNAKIKSITQSTADTTIYNVVLTGKDLDKAVLSISDKVEDASDNKFVPQSLDFVFGDYTGPQVVVTDPASPVATVFTVGLKFNEVVSGIVNGGSAVVVSGGKLDDISKSGESYILTISAKEQTEVTIILTDAIKDMAPSTNKFAGDTLVYKTGDFTAPTLATKTPANAAELTDNHPTFKMTFSEEVKLGAGGSLKIFKVNSTTAELVIPITESMINGKEVTVTYTKELGGLNKDTRYYVAVDGSALTDKAGNKFAGVSDAAVWTFKTGAFATGIEGLTEADFRVYPNPFVGVINIDNASKLSKVVVTNIAGQVVKEVVNPDNSIQLNELRSGVYFISLFDMDNVIAKTAKIVKR